MSAAKVDTSEKGRRARMLGPASDGVVTTVGSVAAKIGPGPDTPTAHVLVRRVGRASASPVARVAALGARCFRSRRVVVATTVAVLGTGLFVSPPANAKAGAVSSMPISRMWETNGRVSSVLPVGHRVYIGGVFDHVGPFTGSGVPLGRASGAPVARVAKIDGPVNAAVADGRGGYYVGGSFTRVGGAARAGLAHVRADGTVDAAWNPDVDGTIRALAVSGSTVYAGGAFSALGGRTRSDIAALDARTGAVTNWDPNARGGFPTTVLALAVSGSTVYAGGDFNQIGGQARSAIAALDPRTGAATGWNPGRSGPSGGDTVNALAVSGSRVYAGGLFERLGGRARSSIAALDARTGVATDWNPGARFAGETGAVWALAVSGSTVYAGGDFDRIGRRERGDVAALDVRTGAATRWNPSADAPYGVSNVTALAVSGSEVYAGGGFTQIGGQQRDYIAALSSRTGAATPWNPNAGDVVSALAVSRSRVYAGGDFSSVGGVTRHNIAALDTRSGTATRWNPDAEAQHTLGEVNALAVSGTTLYAGGSFERIGGRARSGIAALGTRTGTATGWNPDAKGLDGTGTVKALTISGSRVYAGGEFHRIGGRARAGIAALDARTGAATRWNPNAEDRSLGVAGTVNAVAVSGSRVYAGGAYDHIGGRERHNIAALTTRTGAATPWNPDAVIPGDDLGEVDALVVSGPKVYAGGSFTRIGGRERNYIAALSSRTGVATSWNPKARYLACDPEDDRPACNEQPNVEAMTLSGSRVYVGGTFVSIGGRSRNGLAGLDARTASATAWHPRPDEGDVTTSVSALATSRSRIYAGGAFLSMGRPHHEGFAAFARSPRGAPAPKPPPARGAPAAPFPAGPRLLGVSARLLTLTRYGTIRPRLTCLRRRRPCRGRVVAVTGRGTWSWPVPFWIAPRRTATVPVGLHRGQIAALRRHGRIVARIAAVYGRRTVGDAVVPIVARRSTRPRRHP